MPAGRLGKAGPPAYLAQFGARLLPRSFLILLEMRAAGPRRSKTLVSLARPPIERAPIY